MGKELMSLAKKLRFYFQPLLWIIFVTSCVSYNPPPIPKPDVKNWKNGFSEQSKTAVTEKWWESFHDEELNKLEAEALKNSPTLQLAIGRLKEAEAIYVTTRAELLPHFDLTGFANRQRVSQSTISRMSQNSQSAAAASAAASSPSTSTTAPSASTATTTAPVAANGTNPVNPITESSTTTAPTPPNANLTATPVASVGGNYFTQISLTPQMSYEIDFWGKYLNATRATLEQIQANEAAVKTATLMITTEVALRYFELQSVDAILEVINQTIETYKNQLQLNTNRYQKGYSSDLDPLQAEYQYEKAKGDAETVIQQRATVENLLAVAIGANASEFRMKTQKFAPDWIEPIPCLPMEILEKRPDIQEACHNVEAQRLYVGVAKSLFYPQVVLTGSIGYQADTFSKLFKWKNRVLSGTASVFAPIFEGGKIYGQYLQAKAQYEQLVAQYLDQVIVAFREVEDSLAILDSCERQYKIRLKEYEAATKQKDLTWQSYKEGFVDYFLVIYADQSKLSAQQALILARRDQVTAAITLIKSIGGGWQSNKCLSKN